MIGAAVVLGLWLSQPAPPAQPLPVALGAGLAPNQSPPGTSQMPPAPPPDAAGPAEEAVTVEWMAGIGYATSVELAHSRGGLQYVLAPVSWARELTRDHGRGVLRGRLAWVIEITPFLIQTTPGRLEAFGGAPIGLRWNFAAQRRWSAFAEYSGGFLGSTAAIPDGAARFNFATHLGAGLRLPLHGRQAMVLSYRFQHVSNGNRLATNPGVNSHVVVMGWSTTRRRSPS